ncbi:DUF4269 domain-containing protein [Pedobacter sp. ASV28]|uniref:DUF4269 domain-containing protein n=1 Tax=Pedobacter sp. ASV28 TaxID=2795123 RepID=UPI0018EE1CF5|nr:DUF4269 domain-containing protein [Pedobacter sp. ASV28]
MINFENIEYLKTGTQSQQQAYQTLNDHQVIDKLQPFDPILTGTFPININIENSDLDIVCYWENKQQFMDTLNSSFSKAQCFQIRETLIKGQETVVCNFRINHFEIEVFGQNIPSESQNAYRHMLIEHQILQSEGEDFRLKIIELKKNGYKTEPAFAKLLGLDGNPYHILLAYQVKSYTNDVQRS